MLLTWLSFAPIPQALAQAPVGAIVHLSSSLLHGWSSNASLLAVHDSAEKDVETCNDGEYCVLRRRPSAPEETERNTPRATSDTDSGSDSGSGADRPTPFRSAARAVVACLERGKEAVDMLVWLLREAPPVPILSNQMLCA